MLSQIQRFGGAMFTPVLLFPFAGIVVGIAIMLRNPMFVGEALTAPDSLFAQIVHIIEEGGWTVFRNMPLIFAVGLPIGLAKQAQGRACLAVLVSFLTWNYFINAMGMTWGHFFGVDFSAEPTAGSGLTMIAGIKTLDTSIIGAIVISGLVTALHNRYFDKPLPVFLGIFQGSSFVVIVAFLAMIPCAWLTLLGWPKVQLGIESLQAFLRSAGALGVWVYIFLERIPMHQGKCIRMDLFLQKPAHARIQLELADSAHRVHALVGQQADLAVPVTRVGVAHNAVAAFYVDIGHLVLAHALFFADVHSGHLCHFFIPPLHKRRSCRPLYREGGYCRCAYRAARPCTCRTP